LRGASAMMSAGALVGGGGVVAHRVCAPAGPSGRAGGWAVPAAGRVDRHAVQLRGTGQCPSSSSSPSYSATALRAVASQDLMACGSGDFEEGSSSLIRVDGGPSLSALTGPVREELAACNDNLRDVVGKRHPILVQASDLIFGAGGKRLRPILCLLVAKATLEALDPARAGNAGMEPGLEVRPKQMRLAEITEMIHTASLVHDDVLDECDLRRGAPTVNSKFGSKTAVLVGDFLFAQSSWGLANLENFAVIKLISRVIADFANGEIQQAQSKFNPDFTVEEYLDKSYFKTASLIAASTQSAAIFSSPDEQADTEVALAMYAYGKHLGLAFQVVDDILDFTQTADTLGKEAGQDLASGNLTAPALFCLQRPEGEELRELIDREFSDDGDVEKAIRLVTDPRSGDGSGLMDAMRLAREEGDKAISSLACLPASPAKTALEDTVEYVLSRVN